MSILINLLPYMKRIEDSKELLEQWSGGLEIPMDGPNWEEPANWNEEFLRFKDYQGPISVHSPIWELNLASARFEVISQYSYEVYKGCLEWSARIGAEQMVLHPSLYSTMIFNRKQSQSRSIENLKRLGEVAGKLGIDLAVENVGFHEFALFDEEEFIRLFEDIPTISALVDVGHAHINGWNTPELIRRLGSRLTAVHLHDNDGINDLHLPIGEGSFAWEPLFDTLRSLKHPFRSILEYQFDTPLQILLDHARLLERQLGSKY